MEEHLYTNIKCTVSSVSFCFHLDIRYWQVYTQQNSWFSQLRSKNKKSHQSWVMHTKIISNENFSNQPVVKEPWKYSLISTQQSSYIINALAYFKEFYSNCRKEKSIFECWHVLEKNPEWLSLLACILAITAVCNIYVLQSIFEISAVVIHHLPMMGENACFLFIAYEAAHSNWPNLCYFSYSFSSI